MADSAHKTEGLNETVETTQAHIGHGQDAHVEINPMEISGQMVIWTWVLFFITLGALYKVAWKPILGVLDKREEEIQDSIDHAEVLRKEMAALEGVKAEQLAEADAKSKKILDAARIGAQEQAKAIEEKARDAAAILTENAHRDIDVSRALAEDALRIKSAAWARKLAGKLIEENLDDDKNRVLTDKLIEEL